MYNWAFLHWLWRVSGSSPESRLKSQGVKSRVKSQVTEMWLKSLVEPDSGVVGCGGRIQATIAVLWSVSLCVGLLQCYDIRKVVPPDCSSMICRGHCCSMSVVPCSVRIHCRWPTLLLNFLFLTCFQFASGVWPKTFACPPNLVCSRPCLTVLVFWWFCLVTESCEIVSDNLLIFCLVYQAH